MHLLRCNPIPSPEFVSLSLFMKPSTKENVPFRMGEPMILASPLSTVSHRNTLDSVKELHRYLSSLSRSFLLEKEQQVKSKDKEDSKNYENINDSDDDDSESAGQSEMMAELIQEDKKFLRQMQVFRPLKCNGIGLHYRLLRGDTNVIMQIASLILAYSKAGRSGTKLHAKNLEAEVEGVVLCVGFSGFPMAHSSSSLQYGLTQKLDDCLAVLSRVGSHDVAAAQMLLSTLLITDDEHRKSNEMAEAAILTAIPEGARATGGERGGWAALGGLLSGAGNRSTKKLDNVQVSLGSSSADFARGMVDRLRVLSVSESDTVLKKYALSGKERKANLDLTMNKSKFRRKTSSANIPDLDNFDYQGPVKTKNRKMTLGGGVGGRANTLNKGGIGGTGGPMIPTRKQQRNDSLNDGSSSNIPTIKISNPPQIRLPKKEKDTPGINKKVPMLSAPRGHGSSARRGVGPGAVGAFEQPGGALARRGPGPGGRRVAPAGGGAGGWNVGVGGSADAVPSYADGSGMLSPPTSSMGIGGGMGGMHTSKLQVNIALNEDLTCSYKASKMTSCNVEGVVQVQLKAATRAGAPFQILLRDPSRHLMSLQENKKYAEDITRSPQYAMTHQQHPQHEMDKADRRFKIGVPQTNNYFPVLRYKCSQELRPVPIRVQTRVKVDRAQCRVALQISSNPHNEGSLTDLTIIMGVATEIRGETLVTQPVGGVWNAAKRSVIWCVSELGDGEKFQLQAKFDMNPDFPFDNNSVPKFPVLVRCQCMLAQLSDVEVEVRDVPEILPAEVTMRVARRFRLSHQERS